MQKYNIKIAGLSDQGPNEENQDTLLICSKNGIYLAAIFDGHGVNFGKFISDTAKYTTSYCMFYIFN